MDSKLIEKHRDINVWDGWWEGVYDDFKARVKEDYDINIYDDGISFRGFGSQGDGASFVGYVSNDKRKFLTAVGVNNVEAVMTYLSAFSAQIDIESRGTHYPNESCMHIELPDWPEFPGDTYYCHESVEDYFTDMPELKFTAMIELVRPFSYVKFIEDAKTFVRGLARELYNELQTEYAYLTADEAVWETIELNNLHLQEAA